MKLIFLCILLEIYAKKVSYNVDNQITTSATERKMYKPDWNDLDTRPLPQWYDSAKIGIFLHWGVYSVPCFKSEWFWKNWKDGDIPVLEFMKKSEYHVNMTYEEFAPMFKAEKFVPEQWADLFVASGAKYVVITAKHHDGFTLFPSGRPNWNAIDVGPKIDILRVLSKAIRNRNMKFGVYYSLLEWYNEFYLEDKKAHFKTTLYPDNIVWPDVEFLIQNYKPSVLWFDGESEANTSYWKTRELLAWLYNESPVKDEIVVNDRLGDGTLCNHGDIFNCDDKYNPRTIMHHKWENAFPLDKKSWGFRREMQLNDVCNFDELIETIVSTVSCGGNALINVGPTKEGTIVPIFQQRLLQLGQWLDINGEAIYNSSPWFHQRDSLNPDVWYTCVKKVYNQLEPIALPVVTDTIKAVYAIFLKWPSDGILRMKDAESTFKSKKGKIKLLNSDGYALVNVQIVNDVVEVNLTKIYRESVPVEHFSEHNLHAWALKISPIAPNLKTVYTFST